MDLYKINVQKIPAYLYCGVFFMNDMCKGTATVYAREGSVREETLA